MQAMSLTEVSNPQYQGPGFTWVPSYAPVYAVAGNFFSPSPTSNGWGYLYGGPLGVDFGGGDCFQQCSGDQGIQQFVGQNLLVSFANPVTEVNVSQIGNAYNGVTLEAFNSADQEVGYCAAAPGDAQGPGTYQCGSVPAPQVGQESYTVLSSATAPDQWQVQTTISATGISKILIGGYNNGGDQINTIRYAAPELNPGVAGNALVLLIGALLVLRGTRRATSQSCEKPIR